jgi:hypothetical protein
MAQLILVQYNIAKVILQYVLTRSHIGNMYCFILFSTLAVEQLTIAGFQRKERIVILRLR